MTLAAALAALAPLLVLAAACAPRRWADARARAYATLAAGACWTALGAAASATVAMLARGAPGALAIPGAGALVYFDALGAVMLALVAFIGAVVVRYARNYLDGDPGHARFVRLLCLTIAAVLIMVVAGSLVVFAAGWIATSVVLHRLLVFYPERPKALLAARKKFVASRIGDACLLGAAALAWRAFGAADFPSLFAAADAIRAGGAAPAELPWIGVLIAAAALAKSAQLPLHGWLTEVMETPTPVSALLHAGIINAGGFLVVRMSPLVSLSMPALELLAVVGALTALFASAVMLTQTSVKVAAAWSTVGQMGFMLLQCGLGAFSAATLHIVAHALYKAHAFLASGSAVDAARVARLVPRAAAPSPALLAVALPLAAAVTVGVGLAFGVTPEQKPGTAVLAAILGMGVAHLIWTSLGARTPALALRGIGTAALVSAAYFALQLGFAQLLHGAVAPEAPPRNAFDLVLGGVLIAAFLAVLVLQALLPRRAERPAWRAAYVHLLNGLYINAAADRLIRRFWPVTPQGARP
jgi:NAD(P)H-quinone oxidoreductase subunit 5